MDEESKDVNSWLSNKRQEWEVCDSQESCVIGLPGLFQGTAKPKGNSEPELPSAAEGIVKIGDIGSAEVERAMNKMNRGRVTGIDEVRVEMLVMAERVGVKWTKRFIKYLHEGGECNSQRFM